MLINKTNNKIKYVAIGDSIAAGFNAQFGYDMVPYSRNLIENIKGISYPSYFCQIIENIDNNLVEKFANYSLTASTLDDWLAFITSDKEKSSFIREQINFWNAMDIEENNPFKNRISKIFNSFQGNFNENLIRDLQEANLLTISLGANEFLNNFPLKKIIDFNHGKISFEGLTKIFSKIQSNIKHKYKILIQKIKEINPKINIFLISYPIPFLHFEKAFNLLFKTDKDMSEILINVLNDAISEVAKEQKINFINVFDKNLWEKNIHSFLEIYIDIHPSFSGYMEIARVIAKKILVEGDYFTHLVSLKDKVKLESEINNFNPTKESLLFLEQLHFSQSRLNRNEMMNVIANNWLNSNQKKIKFIINILNRIMIKYKIINKENHLYFLNQIHNNETNLYWLLKSLLTSKIFDYLLNNFESEIKIEYSKLFLENKMFLSASDIHKAFKKTFINFKLWNNSLIHLKNDQWIIKNLEILSHIFLEFSINFIQKIYKINIFRFKIIKKNIFELLTIIFELEESKEFLVFLIKEIFKQNIQTEQDYLKMFATIIKENKIQIDNFISKIIFELLDNDIFLNDISLFLISYFKLKINIKEKEILYNIFKGIRKYYWQSKISPQIINLVKIIFNGQSLNINDLANLLKEIMNSILILETDENVFFNIVRFINILFENNFYEKWNISNRKILFTIFKKKKIFNLKTFLKIKKQIQKLYLNIFLKYQKESDVSRKEQYRLLLYRFYLSALLFSKKSSKKIPWLFWNNSPFSIEKKIIKIFAYGNKELLNFLKNIRGNNRKKKKYKYSTKDILYVLINDEREFKKLISNKSKI